MQLWQSLMSHCIKKDCPFYLSSGYCTHSRQDFSARIPFGQQNAAAVTQIAQSTAIPKRSQELKSHQLLVGGQRGLCLPGNMDFGQVLQPTEPLKCAGLEKAKVEGKVSSYKAAMGRKEIWFFQSFIWILSCRSEFSLFQNLPSSNKTKL